MGCATVVAGMRHPKPVACAFVGDEPVVPGAVRRAAVRRPVLVWSGRRAAPRRTGRRSPGAGREVPRFESSAPGPGRPGRVGPAVRSTEPGCSAPARSRSAWAISSATRRCGGRAAGRAGRLRPASEQAARGGPGHLGLPWSSRSASSRSASLRVWVISVWASPSGAPGDTVGPRRPASGRGTPGRRSGALRRAVTSATGSGARRGMPCGTVSTPSRHRGDGRGWSGRRPAGRAVAARRYAFGRHPRHRDPVGHPARVRQVRGDRQRQHRPHRVRGASAHDHRAPQHHAQGGVELARGAVGPVATPYSIQRGPSTPTNSDDASPVRACSSRPHSPVNDRTVAPPSRSDSSISAARSGHSRPGPGRGQRAHREPARRAA